MYKSLQIILLAAFVVTTYAGSAVVFQIPDDLDTNEIDNGVVTNVVQDEKRMALETNEIQRGRPSYEDNVAAVDELDANENQSDRVDSTSKSSEPIYQSKAPSTPLGYFMDFIYGLFQWVYSKCIS